jgi:glycogen synthase
MHILLVSYEFPPAMATGGIGSYMHHLARLLYSKGHTISVISASADAEEQVIDRGFCMNYLSPSTNQTDFRKQALLIFERYFHGKTIDLMESPEVGACALDIHLKYLGIPLLVKMHTPGVLITNISNTYQPLITKLRYVAGALLRGKIDFGYWRSYDPSKNNDPEYQICKRASIILSPSAALKKWATRFWKLPEEKIQLLANPFTADDELFEFPVSGRGKVISFIGKLTVLKGMITFTPAIKKILQANPDYEVVIIGRDEPVSDDKPSMKEWMMNELGTVNQRVRFTGVLASIDIKTELSRSSIVVVPSLWENYPTVVLEAMAAGCAVAASNRGGIPEIIKHGENGLLFNPLSILSMANAIQKLIADEQLRQQLATAGRDTVRNNGNEAFINATEKIYSLLLQQGG